MCDFFFFVSLCLSSIFVVLQQNTQVLWQFWLPWPKKYSNKHFNCYENRLEIFRFGVCLSVFANYLHPDLKLLLRLAWAHDTMKEHWTFGPKIKTIADFIHTANRRKIKNQLNENRKEKKTKNNLEFKPEAISSPIFHISFDVVILGKPPLTVWIQRKLTHAHIQKKWNK